jgi:TonB family protein
MRVRFPVVAGAFLMTCVLSVPVVKGQTVSSPTSTGRQALKLPADDFATGAIADGSPGLTSAVVLRSPEPKYTSDAMRAKVQGTVEVEAIIDTNGTVAKARVSESLDKVYGLDAEAVKAVQGWRFKPAMLAGKPVKVYTKLTLTFRLH